MVTREAFQAFAQERMKEGLANPDQFRDRFKEILDFAVANEASMDGEAKAYFDNLLDTVSTMFEQGTKNSPDSPDKRRMLRAIASTRRQHHRSQDFLKRLGMPYPVQLPIVETARPLFLEAHQSVLDLLWDATRESQHGVAQFATLGLLYWTVDELTTAFYLGERRYTTQAYSHLRTIHDLLDKAELFFDQPQWAEVWVSNNKDKILKELKPSAVRKKLGKPVFDPIYGFFTELGTHGTFEALRKRVTQTWRKDDQTQIAMRIGGTPWRSEIEMVIACCVFTVLSVLMMVGKVYETRLHSGELITILRSRFETGTAFLQEYFVEPKSKAGVDVSVVTESLKKFLLMLKAVESTFNLSK